MAEAFLQDRTGGSSALQAGGTGAKVFLERPLRAVSAMALLAAVSVWFLAIRSPLWQDETSSYWQISAGFWRIMARRGQVSAVYPYILWLATRIVGTSEVGLRIPSVLAMLTAVYVLYCAAKELFGLEVALVTVVIFSMHPLVVFSSIDARPYALGILAINTAIFLVVKLRHSSSLWLAGAFGVCAGAIPHFHLLFGTVLPILAICLVIPKRSVPGVLWRQLAVAFGAFVVVFLPLIPDTLFLFHDRQMYVFEKVVPTLADLGLTVAPGALPYIFAGALLIAAATRRIDLRGAVDGWGTFLSLSCGLVPLLILYGVSAATPTNVFVERYRLVAIPGIALAWGLVVSRIDSRVLRTLVCVVLVSLASYQYLSSPYGRRHKWSWKYALELAEKNAATDHAPVLICSDFPSSDYYPMPTGESVKDSSFFTPLSYYKLSGPVVGLPRALNEQARRIGTEFVQQAALKHERFLAVAWVPSYDTLHWLNNITAETYEVRVLGQPDSVVVLEFTPREGWAGN
jgi:mannosyltransferase